MKLGNYLGIDIMRKLTRAFLEKKSGSLIIHENVSKNEEKKLPKKIYAKEFVQNLKKTSKMTHVFEFE